MGDLFFYFGIQIIDVLGRYFSHSNAYRERFYNYL